MKDTLSSCSDLDKQEIQQLQKQAKNLKEISLSKLHALPNTISTSSSSKPNQRFWKGTNKETTSRDDSNSDFRVDQNFKHYTQMEPQTFNEIIIQNMDSIEQCIMERARHEQELQNRLKRKTTQWDCIDQRERMIQSLRIHNNTIYVESSRSMNECNEKSTYRDDTDIRPSYDTELMAEVPYTIEYNMFAVDTQHYEQPEYSINICVVEKVDSMSFLIYTDLCDNGNSEMTKMHVECVIEA
ncbi:hypothetical protein Tco_0000997 [Tanacetum coccineum]